MACSRFDLRDAPLRRPHRFGLAQTATIEDVPVGDHALGGFRNWTETPAPPRLLPAECDFAYAAKKDPSEPGVVVSACPFILMGSDKCFATGPQGAEFGAAMGRARNQLRLGESWGLERAFQTGKDYEGTALCSTPDCADCRWLQHADTEDITPGGPAKIVDVVAHLESELLGSLVGLGTIHVPVIAAQFMVRDRIIQRPSGGGPLETILGTRIVVGTGYTGDAPDGSPATAGTAWIYATGDVNGVRDAEPLLNYDMPTRGVDVDSNNTYVRVERTYALAADGDKVLAGHALLD